jgi:hypothetical protein
VPAVRNAAEELAIAEDCDARGAHDDAVNALSRAAQLGDIEAATRLGKRLISGVQAPLLPTDGTRLLADAAERGGAEAAARLAVLAAAGTYLQHSLENALQLVLLSARRGWGPSQSQLLAITPDRALASIEPQARDADDYWQRLADSIDLAYWQSAPEGVNLHDAPLVRRFENLLPQPICHWLIQVSRGRLKRALVYDPIGRQDYASETRTNSWAQFDLMECELIHLLAQTRMQVACGLPLHNMEATAILHYAVGEQISNHFDFVDPAIPNYDQEIQSNGQRMLTFLIYLNDDFDGGETEFPELGVSHKGRLGEGLFFVNALENKEPDRRMVHAGRPPTKGEKWIVSQFVRSRRVLGLAL